MSMMISNKTSVMSVMTTVSCPLELSKLITAQVLCSGDHTERIYNCHMSIAGPKQSYLTIHPYDTCDMTRITRESSRIERYSPLIRNPKSVVHKVITITTTIIFLFQMAILSSFFKYLADHNEWETYTRSASKSEEAAKAR